VVLEREICFPKIGELVVAKIGAGGKPLVGDSLRTLGPHEKNLSSDELCLVTHSECGIEEDNNNMQLS